MQSESKLTLKKIFDCFDFDKNGYVDGKELARISREMGEEMS
jgi:Ca2+-binding EF-hand superfamily protein